MMGRIREKPGYTAGLIGYLSVCMLAAAFGSMLGTIWFRYWLIFGTFGLVSAIGLNILSRSRAQSEAANRRKMVALQAEKNLDKIVDIEESFDAILGAVRQIQSDITGAKKHRRRSNADTRVSLLKPVTITPLRESPGAASESFVGSLRNISSHGFGLLPDCFLQRGYVLLEFTLENQDPVMFIADLLWCERQTTGRYFSGGKFLELVSSVDTGSTKPDLAQAHCS